MILYKYKKQAFQKLPIDITGEDIHTHTPEFVNTVTIYKEENPGVLVKNEDVSIHTHILIHGSNRIYKTVHINRLIRIKNLQQETYTSASCLIFSLM